MSEKCRNGDCPRLANRMVRIDNVGDRAFCEPCIELYRARFGDFLRVLEDVTPESVPEWRKRSLAKAWLTR